MRTRDFSRAPRMAQAHAMFTGGNRYASVWALASTVPRWRRMVADMRRMRGYCAHKIYYEPPLTLGVLAWFESMDDLLLFARTGEHRWFMQWATDTSHATAGFIRMYRADPHGYSNGVWRAEDQAMGLDERFTPLSRESQGPPVLRRRRTRATP